MPRYRAVRRFQAGDFFVEEGHLIDFDGTHATLQGDSVVLPQLRGAITVGWLVPDYDEEVLTSVDGSHMVEAVRTVSRSLRRYQRQRNEMSPEERDLYERSREMLRVNREQVVTDPPYYMAANTSQDPSPVEYRGRIFELTRGFGPFELGARVIVIGQGTHGGLMARTAVQAGVMFSVVVPEDFLREVKGPKTRKSALDRLLDDDD